MVEQLAVKEEHAKHVCPVADEIPKTDPIVLFWEEVAVKFAETSVEGEDREDVAMADAAMKEDGNNESNSAVR